MLDRIHIVLVEPSHPGNIGAVARAIKTMGLSKLILVSPRQFPHTQANFLAVGADDILQQAEIVSDLPSALKNCGWVIGASARLRKLERAVDNPKQCAEKIRDHIAKTHFKTTCSWVIPPLSALENEPSMARSRVYRDATRADKGGITHSRSFEMNSSVAIVFGRESSGLTNAELSLCHDQVHIPSNAEFSSLNLAAAVQVVAYELRMAALAQDVAIEKKYRDEPLASADEVSQFYEHLRETLLQIHFLDPKQPKRLMERLQLLFNRAHLTVTELNILRGILKAVQQSLR